VTSLRVVISRLLDPLLGRRRERRLEEEIARHLDYLTDEYRSAGLPPDEARQAARRAFGGVDQLKEVCRDERGLPRLDALVRDVRFGGRLLRRSPGFAVTAVLVLGLGIGVNNMLFTILNTHTLRGLPIPRSDRVLFISSLDDRGANRGLSYQDFLDIAGASERYDAIAAFRQVPMVIAGDGRAPGRLDGAFVTAGAFGIIRATPVLGRTFSDADGEPGRAGVVVINRATWAERYGNDPGAIGRAVTIDGFPATVIGVLEDRSGFPSTASAWMPLRQVPGLAAEGRDVRTLQVIARLRDGVSVEAAGSEADGIAARLAREHARTNANVRFRVVPINDRMLGRATDPVWLAFMTVGFIVVFISCANVANLMLDRSLMRTREIAIRAALGGGRRRLLRQLLVEGGVLAAAGAAAGLLVAVAGVRIFRTAIPADALPYWFDYAIDWRVLTALMSVSILTVFVFALVPAIQASKTDVTVVLKDGGRSRRGRRGVWATGFLAVQIALAVVLLVHFAANLRSAGPDAPSVRTLDAPEILTAAVTLPAAAYPSREDRAAFHRAVLERVRGISSIRSAAVATSLPYSGAETRPVAIDGQPSSAGGGDRTALAVSISEGYFRTLGLPLLQGRDIEDGDSPAVHEVVVDEIFVEKFLVGQPALGVRIAIGAPGSRQHDDSAWFTIVGVAPEIRQRARGADPVVYLPLARSAPVSASLLVRTTEGTGTVVSAIREQIQAIDPALPVYRARTLPSVRHDAEWNGRLSNRLFVSLTFIAVALAAFGLAAVSAHRVSRDGHEIGIRMALGARPREIALRVFGRTLVHTSIGLAGGILCTVIWSRLLPPADDAPRALDVQSLAIVASILLGVVVLASVVPMRRAIQTDPLATLRGD
jgi:predicted permease